MKLHILLMLTILTNACSSFPNSSSKINNVQEQDLKHNINALDKVLSGDEITRFFASYYSLQKHINNNQKASVMTNNDQTKCWEPFETAINNLALQRHKDIKKVSYGNHPKEALFIASDSSIIIHQLKQMANETCGTEKNISAISKYRQQLSALSTQVQNNKQTACAAYSNIRIQELTSPTIDKLKNEEIFILEHLCQ
ncbi:hypothetical protein FJQ87_13680 [Shewanella sp. SNU WT4]|uniref:hypothetical protein n=1 Tax=Shewanella sp. SNU WT4 TaxID=2590015 RepID=UPI001127F02D|nr:hypothetical protein [Shewanella sp. SNU WT4]QDF67593.1 hypothetical protein FJQ87_13680 [Shewanella sp. SNU WT4]